MPCLRGDDEVDELFMGLTGNLISFRGGLRMNSISGCLRAGDEPPGMPDRGQQDQRVHPEIRGAGKGKERIGK